MAPFAARITSLSESRAGGSTISALSKPENWSLDNVKLFGQMLLQYSEQLDLLETERETYEKQTRDVQNSLVKGRYPLFLYTFLSDTILSGYEKRGGFSFYEGQER